MKDPGKSILGLVSFWLWMLPTSIPSNLLANALKPDFGIAQGAFVKSKLMVGNVAVPTLVRTALFLPARYRVIYVPGSGCTNMEPIARQYFAGLMHAEILVLHKPFVDLNVQEVNPECKPDFVKWDALSAWATILQGALDADIVNHTNLPQILVGVSEGGEILADIAPKVSNLLAIVLISASGLDPRTVGEMQAKRRGEQRAWSRLEQAVSSNRKDDEVIDGRTLRYWRDIWGWKVTEPLLKLNTTILQVWGSKDTLVPSEAYAAFSAIAATHSERHSSRAQLCARKLEGLDHGLQSPHRDGVQWVWAQLENWARSLKTPGLNLCAGLTSDAISF